MSSTETIVTALLDAIGSRDLRAIDAVLAPTATWQNVPHPVVAGRDAVVSMLADIVTWSDRVRWDVVSACYDGNTAWLERVDRFWIDGAEHAVRCNGVIRVDQSADAVAEVRDYVDLGEWRTRVGPVLAGMADRPATSVVRRHLDAVARRDPTAMAADYALDAEVRRGTACHSGWRAIADYFESVPQRLEGRSLRFGTVTADGPYVTVPWTIADDTTVVSGSDEFEVRAGRIARQVVRLETADF